MLLVVNSTVRYV